MKYPVKVIRSTMRGAPVRNGTPGTTINVLDACLVNGFGEVTALSLTIVNGVATAVLNTNESFEVGATVWVSGAGLPSMNEEQRITAATVNSISWKTLEANQTVTGTILIKVAPLGWIKPHAATSIGVYQSTNPLSTKTFVRVDDTRARTCIVNGVENMTDANNGTEWCPPAGYGTWWPKSRTADTTARDWVIIGNDKWFYIMSNPWGRAPGGPLTGPMQIHFMGDFKKNPDQVSKNNYISWGQPDENQAEQDGYGASSVGYCDTDTGASRARWVRRGFSGVPGAVRVYAYPGCVGSAGWSGSSFYVPFPNGPDGALRLVDIGLFDPQSNHFGYMPSLKIVAHNANAAARIAPFSIIQGNGANAGREYLMIHVGNYMYNPTGEGVVAFDLTAE